MIKDTISTGDGVTRDETLGCEYKDFSEAICGEFNKIKDGSNTAIFQEITNEKGETLFKKKGENKTMLHGLQFPLSCVFDLPEYTSVITVDGEQGLQINNNKDIKPRSAVIDDPAVGGYYDKIPNMFEGATSPMLDAFHDKIARKIFGYMLHSDGTSATTTATVDRSTPGFDPEHIIPFRITQDDDVEASSAASAKLQSYAGRKVETEDLNTYTKYFFKRIKDTDIKLTALDKNGTPIARTLGDVDANSTPLRAAVSIRIKIDRTELKDHFRIFEGSVTKAGYSGISLLSGLEYTIDLAGVDKNICTDFHNVKVTNRANLPEQHLGANGQHSLIYVIYFK